MSRMEFSRRDFLRLSVSVPAFLLLACSRRPDEVQELRYYINDLRTLVHDETRRVELDEFEWDMIYYTNIARINRGIFPLFIDPALVAVARIRSGEMASLNYISHTRQNETTAFTILDKIGYPYIVAGENIAKNNSPGSEAVDTAFNGFMDSPGHKANILNPEYNRLGIGYAERNGWHIFTQIFAGKV